MLPLGWRSSWTVTDGWRSTRHRRKRRFPTRTRISLRPIRRPWCVSLRCRLPIRCVTTTKPRAKRRLAAAWPTRRRRACSGSVSAESSEKSPSTAALCGRCSSSAACCSPSRRSPWLGLAGMAAHRNASLPDGRRSRRLPGKAALTSKHQKRAGAGHRRTDGLRSRYTARAGQGG